MKKFALKKFTSKNIVHLKRISRANYGFTLTSATALFGTHPSRRFPPSSLKISICTRCTKYGELELSWHTGKHGSNVDRSGGANQVISQVARFDSAHLLATGCHRKIRYTPEIRVRSMNWGKASLRRSPGVAFRWQLEWSNFMAFNIMTSNYGLFLR